MTSPRQAQTVDALFELLRSSGDSAARDALIERHLPLARSLARRYFYTPQPIEDLTQVASLGLVKAVDAFDPARGVSFVGFAIPTIVGELKRSMRDTGWAVRVPRSLQERAAAVDRAERVIAARSGATPTVADLAAEAGLSSEEVLEALTVRLAQDAVALDSVSSDSEELHATDVQLDVVDDRLSVSDALRRLPKRERMILQLRFGQGLTQTEIAQRVGLSQMYVSRLLRATLQTLRSTIDDVDQPRA